MSRSTPKLEELGPLPTFDGARIDSIQAVNYRPHPFMIDPKLVEAAADRWGGILGAEVCNTVGCGWRGESGERGQRCGLPLAAHSHDTVVIVKLARDVEQEELRTWLQALNVILEPAGVDGYAFLEGFKILKAGADA